MFAQLRIGEQYKSTYTRASILPHVGITISTLSNTLVLENGRESRQEESNLLLLINSELLYR